MKNGTLATFLLGIAAAVLLLLTISVLPGRSGAQSSGDNGVFSRGKSYSVHLAGFDDRKIQVIDVSGKWLRVKSRHGEYWLNSDWILEGTPIKRRK